VRSTTGLVAVSSCLLLVLALSGVATGTTQSAPPKRWVAVFCGSVATWENTVKRGTAKLDNAISGLNQNGKTDLPAARARLVGFLAGIVKATDVLTARVKAVGAPNVKNGAKIQSGVLTAFGQMANAFDAGRKSAKALSTTSAHAFSKGAKAVATTIQSSTNRVGAAFTALNKYSTKALNDAARKDKACLKLSKG
jgi:hypothetical protein